MSKPSDKPKSGKSVQHKAADYESVLSGVVELLDAARRASARVVNSLMTATYWEIGRRIVEHEQAGKERAAYGEELLTRLSADLTKRFGRGFSVDNLERARKFYLTFASAKKSATALRISASSAPAPISATALRKSSRRRSGRPIARDCGTISPAVVALHPAVAVAVGVCR